MKKFVKLSSAALLVSGLVMAGAAMAASAPQPKADTMPALTKAPGANVAMDVLANDKLNGSTANPGLSLSSKPSWGTAVCTGTTCTYTIGANSVGKTSDSFIYAYSYKYNDSKGIERKGIARATVTVPLTGTTASP